MSGIKSHFVPQFYLKNFGENIFLFDKKRKKIHKSTPRTVAHKSNFYGPMIEGEHPLEAAFSQIEGESNLAIKDLIKFETVKELSLVNYVRLCKFIALQYVRTEARRIQIEQAGNFAFRELFSMHHPEFDRELIERLAVTNELSLSVHLNAIKEYTKYAAVIHNMKFIILKNKTKFPLWTSDNPVGLFNSIDYSEYSGLGVVVAGIEMHIPINPELCLMVCDPIKFRKFPEIIELSNDIDILRENWIQVVSAVRFLYSNTKRFFEIKKLIKEEKDQNYHDKVKKSSKVIIGKKLNKKPLKFWANQEILEHIKPERETSEIPPYEEANPNSEYIMMGMKNKKSKYSPKIHELKF